MIRDAGVTRGMAVLGGLWIALAGIALWVHLRGANMPLCLFRRVTGLECPACGTTRAVGRLLEGDIPGAVVLNPLMTCLFAITPFVLAFHAPLRRAIDARRAWSGVTIALVLLVGANWWYVLAHPDRGRDNANIRAADRNTVSGASPIDDTPRR